MSYSLPYTSESYFLCLSVLTRLNPVEDIHLPSSMISITIDSTAHLFAPELFQILQSRNKDCYTYQHLASETHSIIKSANITDFLFELQPLITSPATIELIHGENPVLLI